MILLIGKYCYVFILMFVSVYLRCGNLLLLNVFDIILLNENGFSFIEC